MRHALIDEHVQRRLLTGLVVFYVTGLVLHVSMFAFFGLTDWFFWPALLAWPELALRGGGIFVGFATLAAVAALLYTYFTTR